MIDKFAQSARRALFKARKGGGRAGDLLAALLYGEDDVPSKALAHLKVDAARVREEAKSLTGEIQPILDRALAMSPAVVRSEHLLLALLEGEGAEVFRRAGTDPAQLAEWLVRLA